MTVKERPILFSGAMVEALLAGSKTQTRRVVKPQPLWVAEPSVPFKTADADPKGIIHCPYGRPGNRLWVREAFATTCIAQAPSLGKIYVYRDGDNRTDYGGPWRPSIHMPRAASRILLEILPVRIERLNDISEEDAIAEGIRKTPQGFWSTYGQSVDSNGTFSPKTSYRCLWESINGAGSWEANPWVWVVDFRRVTP